MIYLGTLLDHMCLLGLLTTASTNDFHERLLALTPESANEIAKKFILPDHLVWVVVGDMNKVEQGIRELNLGEIHKIDADRNPVQ